MSGLGGGGFGVGLFGAGGLGASSVAASAQTIESNGGYRIDLEVGGLNDGDYTVYVGPLGNALDPRCYVYRFAPPGADVHGYVARASGGKLVCYSPVLTVGGPYKFTLVPQESDVTSGSRTATSNAAGTVVSLSSGVWGSGVVAGLRLRILDGPSAGLSALILTVDSSTQVTLVGAGLGTLVVDASWEIVRDGGGTVTTLPVLTVVRYYYRTRTFSARSWLPGFWGVGPRRLLGVPLQ